MPLIAPQPRRPPRRRRATKKKAPLHPVAVHTTNEAERVDYTASLNTKLDDRIEVVDEFLTMSMLLDFALQPIMMPMASPIAADTSGSGGDASYVPGAQGADSPARSDLGGLSLITYQLKMAVAAAFQISPGSIGGRAYRPYKSDHTTGHAIDIPGSGARGDTIAAWVIERAPIHKVKYIIFNHRIWYPGRGWKPYTPSQSVINFASDPYHERHVHVSTY